MELAVLYSCIHFILNGKGKGKEVPLQAWTGP
jgi:hypothetical protein